MYLFGLYSVADYRGSNKCHFSSLVYSLGTCEHRVHYDSPHKSPLRMTTLSSGTHAYLMYCYSIQVPQSDIAVDVVCALFACLP